MRGLPPSSDGLYNDQASPRTSGKEEDEAFLLKAVTEISEQVSIVFIFSFSSQLTPSR